jgi:chloramphenicol 3-O phosphotransferase
VQDVGNDGARGGDRVTGGPEVLVLNGGSSAGKTTLARRLQDELDGSWLRLGVDTLVDAAPARLFGGDGLDLAADGSVGVGEEFIRVEAQWMAGVAAMVRAGARVVVEDNFVSGPVGQQRWSVALAGLRVGWVGVRCAPDVAEQREGARGDRVAGMARSQADAVHVGIAYDLEVDTGAVGTDELARVVVAHFFPPAAASA